MKVGAHGYEYEGRITLTLEPETEIEKVLLSVLWKHGSLEVTHGGFAITIPREDEQCPSN